MRAHSRTIAAAIVAWAIAQSSAYADSSGTQTPSDGNTTDGSILSNFLSDLEANEEAARASQPEWAGLLVTPTALLGNRIRFDTDWEHSTNGTSTTLLDDGKGVGVVVDDRDEIQIGGLPYDLRSLRDGNTVLAGFGDGPLIRFERNLASENADEGDYAVSAWVQAQAPSDTAKLSSDAWMLSSTIAAGKAWGSLDVQSSIGIAIPTSHMRTLGTQVAANAALQYRLLRFIWPELEINATYYPDGRRGGLMQTYLTTGLVLGKFPLTEHFAVAVGAGYELALSPSFHPDPPTPAFDHALILSTRADF